MAKVGTQVPATMVSDAVEREWWAAQALEQRWSRSAFAAKIKSALQLVSDTERTRWVSKTHAHEFDEYVLVVEGRCTVNIGGQRRELVAGDELTVPKGTLQSMEVAAGTRTVHVFGGKRALRQRDG